MRLDQTHLSVTRTHLLQNCQRYYSNTTSLCWSIQRLLFNISDFIRFPAKENPVVQAKAWVPFLMFSDNRDTGSHLFINHFPQNHTGHQDTCCSEECDNIKYFLFRITKQTEVWHIWIHLYADGQDQHKWGDTEWYQELRIYEKSS